MRYCPQHQRGYFPGGYHGNDGGVVPPHWYAVQPEIVYWAQVIAAAFPAQVQLLQTACDACVMSAAAEDSADG